MEALNLEETGRFSCRCPGEAREKNKTVAVSATMSRGWHM